MIGPKKLSAIRQDLRRALAATGEDPIRWLDQRVTAGKQNGIATASENEVLQSLRRFLQTSGASGRERKPTLSKVGRGSK